MEKIILRKIFLGIILISILFGQRIGMHNGIALDGSSGLFLNPSPMTIGVGHFTIGLAKNIGNNSIATNGRLPFTVSIGITSRTELYYYTDSWQASEQIIEENSSIGLRLKILNLDNSRFAIDLRGQFVDVLSKNVLDFENRRLVSRVITNFKVFDIDTYVNGGFIISNNNTFDVKRDLIGGIGIILPIMKNINGIIDYKLGEYESLTNSQIGSVALKYYLFNHVQLALGYYSNFNTDFTDKGLFVNLSVSSEILKGVKRRIPTKQGLPLPPSLLNQNINKAKSNKIANADAVIVKRLSMNEYIKSFVDKKENGELPIIPPLDMMDEWKEKILLDLPSNASSKTVEEILELPFPPQINFSKALNNKNVESIQQELLSEEELFDLPTPPPLINIYK